MTTTPEPQIGSPLMTLAQADSLLKKQDRNQEWSAAAQEAIEHLNAQIAQCTANLDASVDVAIRSQNTNLIGQLIGARIRLSRELNIATNKKSSLGSMLKQVFG